MREGLRTGKTRSLSSIKERTLHSAGGIFLGSSTEEVREQLELFSGDEPGTRTRNWAIFEVRLPENHPLLQDYEGYTYTTRDIPPQYLKLIHRDSTMFKYLKELYEHK